MRIGLLSRFPCVFPILWLALLLGAAEVQADEPAMQRWAIVTADASLVKVSELLTAELSRLDGVTLVERDEIQKVLGELQLTAAGLVEAEKSLKLGQTLSAEAILLVDAVKENRAMARARLIETRTGVRLWDWTGLVQRPDQQAATIASELKTSREKLAVPEDKRRYVGMIGVHSEEAGGTLNGVASALGALLEFDLQSSPEIVVLEREQLGRLQRERELTGLELKLKTAAVLLEGAIRRDGAGCIVTLRQTNLSGAAAVDVRLELPSQAASELRGRVVAAATKLLGSAAVNVAVSPEAEAAALLARLDRIRAAGRIDDAVGLAEAAFALTPSAKHRDTLLSQLNGAIFEWNNAARGARDKQQRYERLLVTTRHALRYSEIQLLRLREISLRAGNEAFQPAIEFAGDDAPAELRQLQQELYRTQDATSRWLLDQEGRSRVRLRLLAERIGMASRLTADPDEFCRDMERQVADLAETLDRHGGDCGEYQSVLKGLRAAVTSTHVHPVGGSPTIRQWPDDRLTGLFRTLSKHPHPLIAMAGLEGLLRLPGDESHEAAVRLLKLCAGPSLHHPFNIELEILRLAAAGRLKLASTPPATAEELVTRAGKTWNRSESLLCLRTAWQFPFFDKRYPPEFYERLIAVLDSREWTDYDKALARGLRDSAVAELNRLAPNRTVTPAAETASGPWAEYVETPLKFDVPSDYNQLMAFGVDRSAAAQQADEEILLSFSQKLGKVSFDRLGIRSRKLRPVGSMPVAHRLNSDLPWFGRMHFQTAPDAIFLVTGGADFGRFTRGGSQVFGEREGAPGQGVFASACLDGSLYLAYSGALAKFDPQQEKFTLLASAAALQKNGPLDGIRASPRNVAAVPECGCLLVTLTHADKLSGIWKFTPATNEWRQVFQSPPGRTLSELHVDGSRVFFLGMSAQPLPEDQGQRWEPQAGWDWLELDVAKERVRRVPGMPLLTDRNSGREQPAFVRVDDHFIMADGRLHTREGSFAHPQPRPWTLIEPYGRGFLAATMWAKSNEVVIRKFSRGERANGTAAGPTPSGTGPETVSAPALRFGNTGGLEIADPPALSAKQPFTIELWMNLTPTNQHHLLLSRGESILGWQGSAQANRSSAELLFDKRPTGMECFADIRQWTHVALCGDGREFVQLFVNGDPILACTPTSPLFGEGGPLRVGHLSSAPEFYRRGFNGELRALRISSTARYAFRFQSPLTFDKDDQTELLLDFSKGEGNEVPDISGHNRHAKITAGTWVIAAPTGTTSPTPAAKPMPPAKPAAAPEPVKSPPANPPAPEPRKLSRTIPRARWAVIAAPELRQDGFSDLLTATLSTQDGLELVEREQLELATKELELATCLGPKDAAKRLKLGQVLKADSLALLSVVEHEKKKFLKLTVSDCVQGARLRVEHFAYAADRRDAVSKECGAAIQETRERFAGGITQLVAVTPFLSKNLKHNYDHLQSGFAALLASSLAEFPGVAVLEIEEARAISQELNLTAAELKQRIVPLFVEGDFDMTVPPGETEPLVRLAVRAFDSTQVKRKGERTGLTLDQVTDLLSKQLPPRLLSLGNSPATGFDREQQGKLLSRRAAAFAELGAFEHAVALREAALLLQPGEHLQRMQLLVDLLKWLSLQRREYSRRTAEAFPRPADREAAWQAEFEACWLPAQGLVHHATELLRRRAVNPREGAVLLRTIGWEAFTIPSHDHPERVERTQKQAVDFLWEAVATKPKLDAGLRNGALAGPLPGEFREQSHPAYSIPADGAAWTAEQQHQFWLEAVTLIICGRFPPQSMLTSLERYLAADPHSVPHVWMARLIFSNQVNSLPVCIAFRGLPRADVKEFYRRLAASEHPVTAFYGRCGLLECRRATMAKVDATLQQEAQQLENWLAERCRELPDRQRVVDAYKQAFAECLKATGPQMVNWQRSNAAGKNHPLTIDPIPAIEPHPRVVFEPVEVNQPADWREIIATETADILVAPQAVSVMREPGKVERLATIADSSAFYSVVSDGRQVWMATLDQGVWVYALSGELVAKFGAPQGLPEYNTTHLMILTGPVNIQSSTPNKLLVLHPISPGVCLATGVSGPLKRRWFARLSLGPDGKSPQVQVFHNCTRLDEGDDSTECTFSVDWLTEYASPGSTKRRLLLGRPQRPATINQYRRPLSVDLDTLEVSLFPKSVGLFGSPAQPETWEGRLLYPGARHFQVLAPSADAADGWTEQMVAGIDHQELQHRFSPAQLLPHDGRFLFPGLKWRSIDPRTLQVEPLHTQFVPQQHRFSRYGKSKHYGLVGWHPGDRMYRVQIDSPEMDAAQFRDGYVPPTDRDRHRRAVQRIQELGGHVDGRWGERIRPGTQGPIVGETRRQWFTMVVLPQSWRGGDEGLATLADLYNVGELYLIQTPVGDAALRHVGQLTQLRSLYIEETAVTDAGIAKLENLRELGYCRLEGAANGPHFTNVALQHIRKLTKLTHLTLYGPGFTDEGLNLLQSLPKLSHVILVDCATTREGFESLRRTKPGLQHFLNPAGMLHEAYGMY